MDTLFENAHRIFDVARSAAAAGNQDFALLIRPDGGLHFVMESPFSMEAVALHCGARTAYRITRSGDGVRVDGRGGGRNCVLEESSAPKAFSKDAFSKEMLRDQPLYCITSPLLTS
jgi:hypothetical protein